MCILAHDFHSNPTFLLYFVQNGSVQGNLRDPQPILPDAGAPGCQQMLDRKSFAHRGYVPTCKKMRIYAMQSFSNISK